jgi:hypothetical protein
LALHPFCSLFGRPGALVQTKQSNRDIRDLTLIASLSNPCGIGVG